MNILVTGATGFIGSHTVDALLNDGHTVVGIGRRQPSRSHARFNEITGDLRVLDLPAVVRDHGIDGIIHAASKQPGGHPGTEALVNSNIIATDRLMQAAASVRRIVFLSSMSIYGAPPALPVREDAPVVLNVQDEYSLTKLYAERIVGRCYREGRFFFTLRLASVFGPGHGDGIIHTLATALRRNEDLELFSRGETLKETVHVRDVVEVIRRCLVCSVPGNHTVNVGHGERRTLKEIAEVMRAHARSSSAIVLSDKRSPRDYDFLFDIGRMRGLLQYTPAPLNARLGEYLDELTASEQQAGTEQLHA